MHLRSIAFLIAVTGLLGGCRACSAPAGGVVTETTRARMTDALPPSAISDGKMIRLRGVRGETLGLQVRTPADTWVRLTLPGVGVDAFTLRVFDVKEPSTEMYGPTRGKGLYPDRLYPTSNPVAAGDGGAFFDVVIARGAKPGKVSGELSIGDAKLPVELTIDAAEIDLDADPLVWAFYLPSEIAKIHRVLDDDSNNELDHERRYVDLARKHGIYLASDQPPDRARAREEFMRGLRWWPVSFSIDDDKAIAAGARETAEYFKGKTIRPIFTPVDEPSSSEERKKARHVCQIVRDTTRGELLCAVTAEPHPELDGPFDIYFSPRAIGKPLPKGARALTYNGKPPSAGSMVLDAADGDLRSWGWLAWRYKIDLWYAWEALYVRDRYNAGRDAPMNVLTDPLNFDERRKHKSEDHGNLDGLLLMPGPEPTLRLKTLRRGLQDRLLLQKLERCNPTAATTIATATVPRGFTDAPKGDKSSWPADEQAWEAARLNLLDALAACK
jgi:hypothetical protein